MEELTITEIANQLKLNRETVKKRLIAKGILPVKIVGTTGIYDPLMMDFIKETPGKGRPKKIKS